MEKCVQSLQTLFAALTAIGLLSVDSMGFPVHGSAVARGIQHGNPGWISNPAFRGQKFQAHGRSSYHYADEENGDGFDKNLGDQNGIDNRKGPASRQLKQESPNSEVVVLMAFKAGITGDPLGVFSSWNSNDSNPCHWRGVTCSRRSNSVLGLELDDFQLNGTISPLLGTLQNLQRLNLSVNSFHGGIPASLLNCSHLTHLVLRDNDLNGRVPSELGNLRNLQSLDLSNNFLLGGDLPTSLGNCTDLRLLDLHFTSVGGEIPESLGQLSHLTILNLSYAFNSGTVPKSLGNCSALTYLDIGNLYDETASAIDVNNSITGLPSPVYLSGELPAELGQLTRLATLGVFGANIGGAFPSWIANLTSLKELGFVQCYFTGEIPHFLGRLPLELLVLVETNLTGTIPEAILNCTNLWLLAIATNPHMSGPIPPGIGVLRKLGAIDFNSNNLIGRIPSSMSNCSRLRVLNLHSNPLLDPQPIPSWVISFVNLTWLSISNMNLVGEIPESIGQVSKLDLLWLAGNQFHGTIPEILGNFTYLINLSLQGNLLTGVVPEEIWRLPNLEMFYIGQNLLTGIIPPSIGNWSHLIDLGVNDNLFSGEIPFQLGMLHNLAYADFSLNNFSGPIPRSIGNCSALQFNLSFSQNQLSGSLPSSLGNLTLLEQLFVSGNKLAGQIPVDLMRCTNLAHLDMSQNFLVGSVPQEIAHLVFLQILHLQSNRLSGALPHSLGSCQSLLYVDLSLNKFSGSIPEDAIANISASLVSLDVSRNVLSGSLPQNLGKSGKSSPLYYLNFSFNYFSGLIPLGFGDCKSLEILDLSVNNLSGDIPQNLGQLTVLAFVNMSYNHFEGPLPNGGLFNSSNLSTTSFLGNSGLCGTIFLKDCPTQLSPSNASHCRGFRCHGGRVAAVSVGTVLGLMILGVVMYWLLSNGLVRGGHFLWGLRDDRQCSLRTQYHLSTGLTLSDQELLRIIALPENIIGAGERSTVYKATLSGGTIVAVKILNSGNGDNDFDTSAYAELHREVHTLSSIRHRNIVRVLGFMTTQQFTALFLEYMSNGSLHKQLYGVEECVLTWRTRLHIAVGVAEGIFYLHHEAHEPIIHRDLKPGNILLDADLEPKLGDFGISKFANPQNKDHGETTVSRFCGTTGYIPPEYGASTVISMKGDVYSFGVILLELLIRKHPVLADNGDSELEQQTGGHIVDLVLAAKETPLAVVDPMLLMEDDTFASSREVNERELQIKMFMQVGMLCTQKEPERRPAMSEVQAMLRQIQELGLDLPDRPTVEDLASEVSDWRTQDLHPPLNLVSG